MAPASVRPAARAPLTLCLAPARRSLLVALGGHGAPIEAIDLGRRIAATIDATLHGIFVWPWPIAPSEVPRLLEIDPEVLSGMVLDVEVGDAAERIAARTQTESVAFLVLPAEREGPDPCGLGLVAARALQHAGSSVIIVRPGQAPRPLARILVPLDGTPRTAAAMAPAGELARFAGATLDIVMVGPIDRPTASDVELGAMSTPQYIDQPQHEWAAFSREFTERFLGALGHCPPDVSTRFFLRLGDPANEILRAARDLASDLIVLVWHGDCDSEHGRVFQRVLREADLPVLVLRC
jgi:nucleotide-binding universal stress UspA family protein